jgi:hypothetical protein
VEETLLSLVSGVCATGFFHGAGYLELRFEGNRILVIHEQPVKLRIQVTSLVSRRFGLLEEDCCRHPLRFLQRFPLYNSSTECSTTRDTA